jgi:hypothetical protein
MVDTPVGKKCRACADNRTHLSISTPTQVLMAFTGAMAVAVPAGWMAQQFLIFLLALPYGWLVGEVALRAGQRSRSGAVQVVTGLAAVLGGVLGAALPHSHGLAAGLGPGFSPEAALSVPVLLFTALGTIAAVSRVRFL